MSEIQPDEFKSELLRLQQRLNRLDRRFTNSIVDSPIALCQQDTELKYTWAFNAPTALGDQEMVGKTDFDLFPAEEAEALLDIKNRVLKSGVTERQQVQITLSGSVNYYDLTVKALTDDNATITGLNCTAINITKQKEQLDALTRLVQVDALTGLQNLRGMRDFVDREWRLARRSKTMMGFLFLDIDAYTQYKESFGHLAATECLKKISSAIKASLNRPTDFAARYEDQRFAIILPNTNLEGSAVVAENIRKRVELLQLQQVTTVEHGFVSVSIGAAAMLPSTHDRSSMLMDNADKALLLASYVGNRVITFEDEKLALEDED